MSPHKRGEVPAVVGVAGVVDGAAAVAAAATVTLLLLLLLLVPVKLTLPEVTNDVGGLPSAPARPRLQVLPLAPRALRVAPGSTPLSCQGWTRSPSLPPSFRRRALPARALRRCRLPLFGNRGELVRGRGRGRR